jgi:hypothetical protein
VAGELKGDVEAKALRTALQAGANSTATVLRKDADLDLTVSEGSNPAPGTGGFSPGGFGPGGFGAAGFAPGGFPMTGGPPAGGTMPAGFMGARGGAPGGFPGPGFGNVGGRPGGVSGEGGPGGDGQADEKPAGKDGTVTVSQRDKTVLVNADINLKNPHYQVVVKAAETIMIRLKGDADMINPRSRVHELAAATQAYLTDKGHFPRGTIKRTPGDRGIDWRPDQRLSWFVDVLPYVADGEYRDLPRDPEKAWNEEPNASSAEVLIPQFLDRAKPATTYRVRYPSRTETVAATHWVGISGVGRDAAEYKVGNAATAKKLGVFGYDRETKKEDVKDGLDKTILLIQVPTDHKSPWLLGGGATVRGVSDEGDKDNPLEPFICTEYQGKKGTYAIMCDGKVRFIPADLPAATFRALCTIAGGETIDDLDKLCPVIAPTEVVQPPPLQPAEVAPPPSPEQPKEGESKPQQPLAARSNQLKQIGLAYHNYAATNGKPPAKAEDLAPFYENDAAITAALREGQYVIFWNASFQKMTQGTSNTILGYEKATPDQGGLVLMADGSVKTMTAKEFKEAPKADGAGVKGNSSGQVQNAREAAGPVAMAAMSRTCAQCHTGPRAKGDTMLFTGPNEMNRDAPWDKIKQIVAEGKMPPKQARTKLSPEDAKAIITWIGG